jgi:hypothetical protein
VASFAAATLWVMFSAATYAVERGRRTRGRRRRARRVTTRHPSEQERKPYSAAAATEALRDGAASSPSSASSLKCAPKPETYYAMANATKNGTILNPPPVTPQPTPMQQQQQ